MERIEETKANDLIFNESLNMPQIGISETKTRYEERMNEFWGKRDRQFKKIEEMGGIDINNWGDFDNATGTIIFDDGSCCCIGTGANCGEIKEDYYFPLSEGETAYLHRSLREIRTRR